MICMKRPMLFPLFLIAAFTSHMAAQTQNDTIKPDGTFLNYANGLSQGDTESIGMTLQTDVCRKMGNTHHKPGDNIPANLPLSRSCQPYLEQTPPGNQDTLFPPDFLQANPEWFWHGVPGFSPDGTEMYFTKYHTAINKHEIWYTECVDEVWTDPQKAPFSNTIYSDNNPFFKSADTLFFQSYRTSGAFIFRVTRDEKGEWSAPVPVILPVPLGYGVGLQFSISEKGNIYAELSKNGNDDIYVWRFEYNQYSGPEKLTEICTPYYDGFPYIDKHERFILFTSDRVETTDAFDIFISVKNADNTWGAPLNLSMGDIIPNAAGWSNISTDGSYLFFTRSDSYGFNPYWIDAQVIYDMIPKTPYLGQTPPGLTPQIFAPEMVSTPGTKELSCTFSPDSTEMYFYRIEEDWFCRLYTSKFDKGTWTEPAEVDFSSGYTASMPHITLDNQRLYFAWNVGTAAVPGIEGGNYSVERTSTGWSAPVFAGEGMYLTSDLEGQLYTTDMSSIPVTGETFLAGITADNGVFESFDRLDIQPHYGSQFHPGIAPDGSYMLFDVEGGTHLFVSFKKTDGTWGTAIDLVDHGFDAMAGVASISPDGKYLFFHLDDDIWWVDAEIIKTLNPNLGTGETSTAPQNDIQLFQNIPNPCSSHTSITFELKKSTVLSLSITDFTGRKVKDLIKNETCQTGKHEIIFDVSTLKAGIYAYSLVSKKAGILSKKMMIVR